ncbi:MAG: organic solvent tolerance protein OstA [Planctomycetota bacterium]
MFLRELCVLWPLLFRGLMLAPLVMFLACVLPAAFAESDIALPVADPRDSITIRAAEGQRWRQGAFEVWLFEQGCELQQGGHQARSRQAVLWIERESAESETPSRVLAYLEGDVSLELPNSTPRRSSQMRDRNWFGQFHTWNEIDVRVPVATGEPQPKPALWERASSARQAHRPAVLPAQWVEMNGPNRPLTGSQLDNLNPTGPTPNTVYQPGSLIPGPVPPPNLPQAIYPPESAPPAYAGGYPVGGYQSNYQGAVPGANPAAGPGGNAALPPGAFSPTMMPPGGFATGAGLPPGVAPFSTPNAPKSAPGAAIKKIESRNSGGFNVKTWDGPDGKPMGFYVDSGVRLVFDAIDNVQFQGYSVKRIDVEADRVVCWGKLPTNGINLGTADAKPEPESDQPIEVYLEGNIVFREGDRVIYAERMYYNVSNRFGVVLNAEMLTPVPRYNGLVRLKAEALQMFNQQTLQANGAALTTSRLGVPRYWFQANSVQLVDTPSTRLDPLTRLPVSDQVTGEVMADHSYLATSRDNWIFVGGLPVFYWPTIATDLNNPGYYLQRVQLKQDQIFGTQVMLDWDVYQLLGLRNQRPGTRWLLSTDYLSKRGPGGGTNYRYLGDTLLGIPGPYKGEFDAWGIYDTGTDNLGIDRRSLIPNDQWRGRVVWDHRQRFGDGYQFTGELGLVSDRNFLEQYYEREWDTRKDLTTGLELKRIVDNRAWSIAGDVRVNSSFMQSDWLPRFDHYWIGAAPVNNVFTWFEHSHIGYAHLHDAATPTDPQDAAKFSLLGGEADREGLHTATRQEFDLPIDAGPVKFVPYVLGEAAYWGEDITGEPLTRLYGQAGVRMNLPLWRADPNIQSELFNLNGLAHKINFETELLYADSSKNLDQLPQYEQLDDDAIEQFRRRLLFNTYNQPAGTLVPQTVDPRLFAMRSGLQSWVSSPVTEIAEDLAMAKLGVRQRWQTKRGTPGSERIIDWIVLDAHASLFANPSRDNFGETLGLLDYDFRWHIGDRFTLLSDGYMDMFDDALRTASIGGLISRPDRGSLYVGYRTIQGAKQPGALTPLDSQLVNLILDYRMNEKWIVTTASSYDFGEGGNHSQSFSLTRAGESFLIRLGANYDFSRDNFGVVFMIEPRALPNHRLGRVAGVPIPPAGALGLE